MKPLYVLCSFIILFGTIATAESNPIPLVNQPLIPMTIKPGSQGFTLTVTGTGFASTAVVTWNGSTRVTSFISSTELQAQISAADVAKPGTASVAAVNPSPGGGTSNVVFFPIQTPTPSPVLSRAPKFSGTGVTVAGDFNNDGLLDLVVGNGLFFDVYFGNGDGTFQPPIVHNSTTPVASLLGADFNGDGKLDLAIQDGLSNTTVFLGAGNGGFLQQQVFRSFNTGAATADFNGDGKLDLAIGGFKVSVRLGNGDGTFGDPVLNSPVDDSVPAIGDFNGDGKLDFVINGGGFLYVFLGNGDGTFQTPVGYNVPNGGNSVAIADVNGDGKLDIITNGVSVLLGNGDGTFTNFGGVNLGGNASSTSVNIGDFNGDGKLDLALYSSVNNAIEILLGNGDGTFQNPIQVATGTNLTSLVMGDFNGDGKLDLVGQSLYLQPPINLSPSGLQFGAQNVGSKSPPKTVTVINDGSSALTITNVGIAGKDPNDFSQTNNCSSLPVGAQCKIMVTFDPTKRGPRSASLNVTYPGFGSPQSVSLSGVGAVVTVTLTPPSLKFSTQLVGTTSPPQTATLTNTGSVAVNISNISTTGAFTETNNCPSSLPVSGSCQIKAEFAPKTRGPAAGQLAVTDDAQGSPQTVALSGTGTVVVLSTLDVNFGNQKVGTKSVPAPVKLTNIGKVALTISQIAIRGADPEDFSQTNNCGNSVPAGGSCTIKVTFTPQAKGQRSGSLQISDNGGGSPQKVALSGNGT
jgi:hypothetical protein